MLELDHEHVQEVLNDDRRRFTDSRTAGSVGRANPFYRNCDPVRSPDLWCGSAQPMTQWANDDATTGRAAQRNCLRELRAADFRLQSHVSAGAGHRFMAELLNEAQPDGFGPARFRPDHRTNLLKVLGPPHHFQGMGIRPQDFIEASLVGCC